MNRHERLNALIELVMASQSIHVDEIVAELGISPATARRDLDTLAQEHLCTRTRGGGILRCSIQKISYQERGRTQDREFLTTYSDYLTTRSAHLNAA